MKRSFCLLFCGLAMEAQDLHVVSATSREVKLAWTAVPGAAGYTVERKSLGGQFAALSATPLTDVQVTDSSISPLTTYVYRVKAPNSQPSKEFTVGPPPVGFSSIVPTPKELKEVDSGSGFAAYTQMAFDSNGDPAAAYYTRIQTGDDTSQSNISFVSWNRVSYRWNAPVVITKVGTVGKPTPFSLARDASTNVYAMVSETTDNHSLPLGISTDNGVTWQVKPAVTGGEETRFRTPTIALAGGVLHLAYFLNDHPLQYTTGKIAENPSAWTKTDVPNVVEGTPIEWSLSLNIDSAGKPGLAYALAPNQGYNVTVAFWRPGESAVKVADSKNFQMDDPFVQLAFSGTKPRIALYLGRTESRFDKNEWNYLSASSDDGKTWPTEPAYLPNDGKVSMGFPMLAFGPKGDGAVMMDRTGGSDENRCGIPKVSRSPDLAHWTTCGPNGNAKPRLTSGNSGKIGFAANGKLYAVIANQVQDTKDDGPAPEGLILWREP